MTAHGFMPMLDECSTKLGSYEEEPPTETARGIVTVHYPDGTTSHDAIGIMEEAGTTVCYGFDWVSPDHNTIREKAREEGVSQEMVEHEIDRLGDESFLMLAAGYPLQNIRIEFAQGLGGIFK